MQKYVDNIPIELQELKQWVGWKKGAREQNGKVTKLPINPHTGKLAQTNNKNTWSDMITSIVAVEQYGLDGIGFVLGDDYFGVDLDDCDEDLKKEFIEQMQSYTEISQSGNGIHIICKGKIPRSARKKGVEIYQGSRYFVMTANTIGDYAIEDGTKRILPLFDKYINDKRKPLSVVASIVENPFNESIKLDDTDLLIKAQNSRTGPHFSLLMNGEYEAFYHSQSEADLAFCNLLSFWSGRDAQQMDRIFRMSGLYRDKWDRRTGATTYGEMTIKKAIENTKSVYSKAYENESIVQINATTGEVTLKHQDHYELTDTGNAQRFVDRFSDSIKYNFENNVWYIWNGKFWEKDITKKIKTFAEYIINEMKKEAFLQTDEKTRKDMMRNVLRASQSAGKEALIKESQHLGDVPIVNNDFDKHEFLLNTLSGVVDLKTGNMLQHNKEYLMSKIVPYEVDSTKLPMKWLSFLDEIFLGDKELIHFMQKAVGYTLTGSIREQSMFLAFGDGSNGKSVFLDIMSRMMGDYGMNAQVESLLERKYGSSNNTSDLARLKGARFTTTGENNQGSKMNEGLIKQLTGGEKITARFLYGTEFEFYPNFKIWLATNHKPIIRGNDSGIWRRIISIPFNYKVPKEKRNKSLIYDLEQEIPQILNWAIQGCLMWQKEGLDLPKAVEDSNKQYQNEMDIITTFLEDHAEEAMGEFANANELYEEYIKWAKASNEYMMSSTIFGREMSKRYEKIRKAYGMVYKNLRLKKDNPTYVYIKND